MTMWGLLGSVIWPWTFWVRGGNPRRVRRAWHVRGGAHRHTPAVVRFRSVFLPAFIQEVKREVMELEKELDKGDFSKLAAIRKLIPNLKPSPKPGTPAGCAGTPCCKHQSTTTALTQYSHLCSRVQPRSPDQC